MKKVLLLIGLPLAFVACSSKNNTPTPDAGTAISGEYQVSRVASFSNDQPVYDFKLPQTDGTNTRTGILVITRSTASTVLVNVVQNVQIANNLSSTTATFGKMTVKSMGNGYEMSQYGLDNQKTGNGTGDGSSLSVEISDTYQNTVTRYLVEAKR